MYSRAVALFALKNTASNGQNKPTPQERHAPDWLALRQEERRQTATGTTLTLSSAVTVVPVVKNTFTIIMNSFDLIYPFDFIHVVLDLPRWLIRLFNSYGLGHL